MNIRESAAGSTRMRFFAEAFAVPILMRQEGWWAMRILDYALPGISTRSGPTPQVGKVLARLVLFLGVSAVTYLLMWLAAVYFVSRLLGIQF